ncbi:PaaX family transcriptional regulator [Streptomyces physcomitrii]|uniref:PaaX family transcriptional regulator n=1 Tax=Streptomyces physcomitrii TaxID=2724184 RepID=A0ABX1H7K2_9ACTN|nr:PaaX family transcriptional regulator C-terminal domain-containing protein [Streptomyces physcomitrii]NKI43219.1 PaaX family transcriptional regulator [Streptomyces physcomitrii]
MTSARAAAAAEEGPGAQAPVTPRAGAGVSGASGTEASGLAAAPPRSLIVTVYGLYSRSHGGWLSVASLIALLTPLGVDEQAVRSAIHRLKRRGVLEAGKQDGAAGYALSAAGRAILREGDARIFRRERATLADGWLLAVFSVPESERNKRHQLRSQLTRLGFGTMTAGVWIAPAHLYEPTAAVLRRLGLSAYAELLRADHLAFGDLAEKVRTWWDFRQLDALYGQFLDTHGPVRERLRREEGQGAGADGFRAFADYVRALTDWRRLPYLDPGLPAELLPADWVGLRAADLFFALHADLEEPARAQVTAMLD